MAEPRKCFVKDKFISADACEDFKATNDEDICGGCEYLNIALATGESQIPNDNNPAGHKLADLNEHLFAQLGRLSDQQKSGDDLTEEIERSKAIGGIAKNIIDNAKLVLDAHKELGGNIKKLPAMIGDDSV